MYKKCSRTYEIRSVFISCKSCIYIHRMAYVLYDFFFVIFDSCSFYKHDILLHDHNARNIEISFHFTYHAVVCS